MSEKKKIVLEFVFEETPDPYDDEYNVIELVEIQRSHSDLSQEELEALGEKISQSDTWRVNRMNHIQLILGGEVRVVDYYRV